MTNPESLLNLVNKAIDEMQIKDEVSIVCNMDDYEYLVGHIEQLKQHPNHTFRINLMVDDMLERGDFRLKTTQGSTDWKVAPQIESMRDVLAKNH
jgi:flagellar biosynthesis/type III secretory pathway protein FliH